MKYFYVGLDISSTHTGLVILAPNGGILEYKLFEPKAKDIKERGKQITKEVLKEILKMNSDNTKVVIENIAIHAKGKVIDLAMIMGAIYYSLTRKDFEVILVPPTTLKKFYTKNGKADKDLMINCTPKHVIDIFKRKHKKIDDLVDAYALAMYGLIDELKKGDNNGND